MIIVKKEIYQKLRDLNYHTSSVISCNFSAPQFNLQNRYSAYSSYFTGG